MAFILCRCWVVILSFCYSSVPVVFKCLFQCHLFISIWASSWVVRCCFSILRGGRAVRGHWVIFVLPSALPRSVAVSCLAPSFPCVFACRCRAVCLVVLSSYAVISASTATTWEVSIPVPPSAGECPLPGA